MSVSLGDRVDGRLVWDCALIWNLKLIITKMHGQQHIKTIKIICSETQQSALEVWETNVDERSLEVGFDKGN